METFLSYFFIYGLIRDIKKHGWFDFDLVCLVLCVYALILFLVINRGFIYLLFY